MIDKIDIIQDGKAVIAIDIQGTDETHISVTSSFKKSEQAAHALISALIQLVERYEPNLSIIAIDIGPAPSN